MPRGEFAPAVVAHDVSFAVGDDGRRFGADQ